ncbi:hypothetical protein ACFW6C_07450 [Streptomyces fungicidicus]|uniref:hypothetical protein n=1 Tax=Streptomyces fungicidicus TaxID=68203 RepID=UPI0036A67ED5
MAKVLASKMVGMELTLEELETIRAGLQMLETYGSTDQERNALRLAGDLDQSAWKLVTN